VNNLKVGSWQDWENICKYLGHNLVSTKLSQNVTFVNYGAPGQKQHGIDLIPSVNMTPAVVIQCKHFEGSLSWNTILSEIEKTNTFSGEIDHYCVFTTGARHTSVQNNMCNGDFIHTRPSGKTFRVHVFYWEDVNPTTEIPSNVLNSFFPVLAQIVPQQDLNNQYLNSVNNLKNTIPSIINLTSINWLETWDFSCGYIMEKDSVLFHNLYIELDRMRHAIAGVQDFYKIGRVSDLTVTLPAGERFYSALDTFINSIYPHIISKTNENGENILTVNDLPNKQSLVHQWSSNASCLAQVYREDILGQSYQ